MTSITQQLCLLSSGHACSSTTATGSDTYAYDNADNRTRVNEGNGATSTDRFYCYDAQNRLTGRKTGSACGTGNDETYAYDAAGNRTAANGTSFAYNDQGQLCQVGASTCDISTAILSFESNSVSSLEPVRDR